MLIDIRVLPQDVVGRVIRDAALRDRTSGIAESLADSKLRKHAVYRRQWTYVDDIRNFAWTTHVNTDKYAWTGPHPVSLPVEGCER
jgi:hypothetical protein